MRDDCIFKKEPPCSYPKLIKVCFFCTCYLKGHDYLDKEINYYTFIEGKKRANISLFMSLLALLLSGIAILVDIIIIIKQNQPSM